MIRYWGLSLRNLRRNVKRNLATGSAIAFGFAGILLVGGYSYRVANYLRVYTVYVSHTGHLSVFAADGLRKFQDKPRRHSLTPNDQERIEKILREDGNVDFFERQLRGTGLVGNGCASLPFLAQGVDPSIDRKLREHPELSRWMPTLQLITQGRGIWNYPEELGAALLSGGLSRALGKTRVHDEIPAQPGPLVPVPCDLPDARSRFSEDANVQLLSGTWNGGMGAVDAEVTGLFTTGFQEGDSMALITSVSRLQKLYDTDNIRNYSIWLKDPSRINETVRRFEAKFAAGGGNYEIIRWDDSRLSPYYFGTVQFLSSLVAFVTLVLAVVIGLSVLNSTTMTVLERSDEIGMYRAFGFRRSQVRAIYLLETLWLCVIGTITGTVIGLAGIGLINSAKIIYHPPGVAGGLQLLLVPDPAFSVAAAAGILVVTLAASYSAAIGRLRLRVADLLGGPKQ